MALLCGPVSAKEWFVSPTGNDSGSGSQSSPFRTIKRVLSTSNGVVQSGDTVTLRSGTYNECDVRLRVKLVLRSYPGERGHIHCDMNTAESVTIQIDPGASGSRLSNLEVSGGMYYGIMLQTGWYQGAPAGTKGATGVVMEDLLIHHTGRDGIKITPKSDNATIRRVEIHHTGAIYPPGTELEAKNADGIDNVNGSGMVVEDSYIHDIATTGLYFKGGAMDVVVQRNRIENTGMSGILVGFDTSMDYFDPQLNPGYYESIRGTVRNNVVRGTDYAGIGLYAAKDAVVANNTIIDAGRVGHAGLYFGITFQDWDPNGGRPPSVNPKLVNNLVIQSRGRCMDIRYSGELGGLAGLTGPLGSDYNGFQSGACTFHDGRPGSGLETEGTLTQWRSATKADAHSIQATFSVDATGHLPSGSRAIDAGIALAEVTDDIDGQARLAKYDIGADEYGQQAPSNPSSMNGSMPLLPPKGGSVAPSAPSQGAVATNPATPPVGSPGSGKVGTTAPQVRPAAVLVANDRDKASIKAPAMVAWHRFLKWLDWVQNHSWSLLVDR